MTINSEKNSEFCQFGRKTAEFCPKTAKVASRTVNNSELAAKSDPDVSIEAPSSTL
jgi:hypothetical protein